MQALTVAISDFALTACKIVQKVNLFRNRVNVLRIKDNLFSMTSKLFPHKFTQRSYTVTQLRSCIRCNWAVTLGRKKYFILYI